MTRKSVTNIHNDNYVLAQLPMSICITAWRCETFASCVPFYKTASSIKQTWWLFVCVYLMSEGKKNNSNMKNDSYRAKHNKKSLIFSVCVWWMITVLSCVGFAFLFYSPFVPVRTFHYICTHIISVNMCFTFATWTSWLVLAFLLFISNELWLYIIRPNEKRNICIF